MNSITPLMRQWEFFLSKCLSLTGSRQGNIDSISSLDSEAVSTHAYWTAKVVFWKLIHERNIWNLENISTWKQGCKEWLGSGTFTRPFPTTLFCATIIPVGKNLSFISASLAARAQVVAPNCVTLILRPTLSCLYNMNCLEDLWN